jgi:predicted hotdog family 3-hydroxylacyl-ACP dehydratase
VPEDLIPQRGPARLVHTIVEAASGTLTCGGRVPATSAFADGGRAPAVVLVELAAQAAAVQQALEATAGGAMRIGYLVAVRAASLHVAEIGADVPLLASVRRTGRAGPLATYDVAVRDLRGEALLTATLSTHSGE